MQPVRHPSRAGTHRRGLTTPAIVAALLLAMLGIALILDRHWLETSQLELTTAAEAAALAGARQFASDDRLLPNFDSSQQLRAARDVAERVAGLNRVAGKIPDFDATGADFQAGNYSGASTAGQDLFESTSTDPHTVRITLHRSRARNNPVALFVGGLTGTPFGDVVRRADASINFQIVGVRPVAGSTVPAVPLAIWKIDPSGNRKETWETQIEQRQGQDNFRFDDESKRPVSGSDGIPELTLRSLVKGGRPDACNLQVLDLGTNFDDEQLHRQFQSGWSAEDLQDFGGLLTVAGGLPCSASPELLSRERDALEQIAGEPRICLLFSQAVPSASQTFVTATCVELVAIRVMAVQDQSDGSCSVIVQPTVLATRAAVVHGAGSQSTTPANKYICNLQLTN